MDKKLPAVCLARVAAFVVKGHEDEVKGFRDAMNFAKTSMTMCEAMRRALRPYSGRLDTSFTMTYASVLRSYRTIKGFSYAFLFLFDATPTTPEVYMLLNYYGVLTLMLRDRAHLDAVGDVLADMCLFLTRVEIARGSPPGDNKMKGLAHFMRRRTRYTN
tara:strand:+ start:269 stop:748 length:480 start_codon:yes stop_codon:yes gene_type:complete